MGMKRILQENGVKFGFQKGDTPHNKGKKGWTNSGSFKKGNKINKGKHWKLSEKAKEKISESLKEQWRNGTRKGGWKFTEESKKKVSEGLKEAYKKGKGMGFQKGHKISYIDGRSKLLSPARYGDDWEAIRYLVYLRDRFTCQNCGIKGISLDIHHKIPFLVSFDNSLNNLIALCRSCHMKIERKLLLKIKQGVIFK